jgi:hypothetical protein
MLLYGDLCEEYNVEFLDENGASIPGLKEY